MNYKTYINKILLNLSKKYDCILIKINTYKNSKKYSFIKLTLFEYDNKGNKKEYYYIEAKNDRELLLKLKEMM